MGDQWNFGKASDRTLDAAIAREMGFGISLHGSNSELLMSALGQKQTYAAHNRFTPNSDRKSGLPHKVMSALSLKADMCSARGGHWLPSLDHPVWREPGWLMGAKLKRTRVLNKVACWLRFAKRTISSSRW